MRLSRRFCDLVIAVLGIVLALSTRGQAPQRDEFRLLLQQGFALHQQAKYTEAIPLLEKARRLDPGDYFANLLLGIDLLRTGKPAAAVAYLRAAERANPEEDTPEEYLGDVMGDLASRRGRIQSQDERGGTQIVNARVPLSEMFGYATDLRSRTQGRATYSMHFDRYEQAPPSESDQVVARVQGRA